MSEKPAPTDVVPIDRNRLASTEDVERIEAPVTWKAYLICAFASFGGIFFGYDSGYINGVNGSRVFYQLIEGPDATKLSDPHTSLIVSILSAGTFFGALASGNFAEIIGRKWTVITGCLIYMFGCIIQIITGPNVDPLACIVAGRVIAGIGVGFESAIVILYMLVHSPNHFCEAECLYSLFDNMIGPRFVQKRSVVL